MATIRKKLWKKYFDLVISGKKKFNMRSLDFECVPGDMIIFEEAINGVEGKILTGRMGKTMSCVR